ncbi:hypothetical protein VIGAN_10039300 [Vigna angularis var. angularis]|nr:hypothetical protein VIGAN_10039300 [Vigna angularis var. angularis]
MSEDQDNPQQLVLIHWQGLPLEEASWELWSQIQAQFHLEDKVPLQEGGDVRPITDEEPQGPTQDQENVDRGELPKRIRRKPTHLNDYVTN